MAIKQYFAQISTKGDSQLQTTKTVYNHKQILMSMPPNRQSMAVSPAGLASPVWTGGREAAIGCHIAHAPLNRQTHRQT